MKKTKTEIALKELEQGYISADSAETIINSERDKFAMEFEGFVSDNFNRSYPRPELVEGYKGRLYFPKNTIDGKFRSQLYTQNDLLITYKQSLTDKTQDK